MSLCCCILIELSLAEFDYLAVGGSAVGYGQFHQSANFLPSLLAGGSGIDVQEAELLVVDYFKDMRVSVDHQAYTLLFENTLHARTPAAGIAAYVGE